MPQLEITIGGLIRENQKDVKPAAEFEYATKDTTYTEYDGIKRLSLAVGEERKIDISSLKLPRLLWVEVVTGTKISVRTRLMDTEVSDIQIGRFFLAEIESLEQLKIINRGPSLATVRVFLAGR